MKTWMVRAALAALLTIGLGTVALLPPPAHAGEPARLRREVAAPLQDAQKLAGEMKFAEALAKVREADAIADKTPDEDYNVAKFLGFVSIQMNDYPTAAAGYDRMLASGAVPPEEMAATLRTATLLAYQTQDYPKVIRYAQQSAAAGPLDGQTALILTQSYYNTQDYANAIKTAEAADSANLLTDPKQSRDLLALLMNSQIRANDQPGAQRTLERMASVTADPTVWSQLIDLSLGAARGNEHHLVNLYRLSIEAGAAKAQDYLGMATLDLKNGLPAEARSVLQKGIAAGTLNTGNTAELMGQANSLAASDEKALPGLANEAKTARNGEIDIKLGESYWSYGRHAEAEAAIRAGIQKGGLKDTADAQTTLGIVLLSQGKKDEALQTFEQAAASGAPGANVARIWASFLKRPAA